MFLLHAMVFSVVSPPANLLILGPGSPQVQLIAGKLAANIGYATTIVTGPQNELRANRLMYGDSWDAVSPDRRPVLASSSSQIGSALGRAEALVLVAESGGAAGLEKALPFAPRIRRIALLSCIGGSTGGSGNLGEDFDPATEAKCLELADRAGVDLAIVRVGFLKGGGAAGGGEREPLGLDAAAYYASLRPGGYESPASRCAQAYDRLMLGASLSFGDSVKPRNAFARSGTRQSHSPFPDEASRISAAGALLACLRAPTPPSVTLSAAEGRVTPTEAEWDQMLAAISSGLETPSA
jgi:hypothetical protein